MSKIIPIKKGKYISKLEINDTNVDITFSKRKKVALLLIGINERYWPYLHQVILDCQKYFLPQHNVDYFVWSDMPLTDTPQYLDRLQCLLPDKEFQQSVANKVRPEDQWWGRETVKASVDFLRNTKNIHIVETEGIHWPAPTLMRFHLFLQEEEKLRDYDYLFYLDADMRVVDKISDEVFSEGLTAAEHPMYSLRPQYVPPYEPNKASTAYIHRLGEVVDNKGKPRFKPYYVAGGFQGGVAKKFIKAMKKMKFNIDKDFNKNYIAIWNDESHWNKYLWDYYKGPLKVLSPSYVYPDSLIKEYYEPVWGTNYPPKIITLTKPFSLSKQAGSELTEFLGKESTTSQTPPQKIQCPQCKDIFNTPKGYSVRRVVQCTGVGKAHQMEMVPL